MKFQTAGSNAVIIGTLVFQPGQIADLTNVLLSSQDMTKLGTALAAGQIVAMDTDATRLVNIQLATPALLNFPATALSPAQVISDLGYTPVNKSGDAMLGLFTEVTAASITAYATGGQTNATQLTAQTNRIDTVATRGDSVKLPSSAPGLEVTVINNTNLGMQVFGKGTDVINNMATAVGIFQPPNSVDTYWCAVAGSWHAETGFGYSGGLGTESAQDSITAYATGGQTNAFQLSTQTVRVSTVATSGDSIKLPQSAPGLELTIINHGANAVQVFGLGTDTINDVATATGVSQMSNSTVIYICASTGLWYTEGLASGYGGPGLQTESFSTLLTAFAGGGQLNATVLTSMLNRIGTVATMGDSAKLPLSVPGLYITVINNGTNPVQVFGSSTDVINGVATATGVSQMQNSIVVYTCQTSGQWVAEGIGSGYSGSFPTVSSSNGLTALASGTQSSTTALVSVINRVTVIATANDAVKLPPTAPGMQITVTNAHATNNLYVWPSLGDAINAQSINTVYSLAAGKTATFTSAGIGNYHSVLSA